MHTQSCQSSTKSASIGNLWTAATLLLLIGVVVEAQVNGGNMSQTFPPDQNSQLIANRAQGPVQQALGSPLQRYQLASYRYQSVNGGVNYFMKILIQTPAHQLQYIHTRIFQSNLNGGQITLNGLELGRSAGDPISYVFMKLCQ
ncbi:hypothetical protein RvY_16242 [Ramazzottius varieornatus]|uniref:Cystatin domain-containing protein n=1 Tax=Ramazzottius varieornatus TaxID=947166 RepID=A0A1D1VYP9_RAMVA|nr:hypothetical protein RvY_16242 [Ramazzottius varieornatus]